MKLLSVGEIIWDIFGEERKLGGASLNFAAHASLWGEWAFIASAVGDDRLGIDARRQISALGVDCKYLSTVDAVTGQCRVTLDSDGVPSYDLLDETAYDLIDLSACEGESFDAVAFGTLAMRGEHNRAALAELLSRKHFSEIFADLNIRPPFYSAESIELCLKNATIVKISDEELPTVTNLIFGREISPTEAVRLITARYGQIRLIVITCGEKGALCYESESGRLFECDAEKTEVVSTVGAGDSFGATFLVNYMKSGDALLSMKLAAKVSAFVVSRQGAIPPDTADFLKSLSIDGEMI